MKLLGKLHEIEDPVRQQIRVTGGDPDEQRNVIVIDWCTLYTLCICVSCISRIIADPDFPERKTTP